MPSVSDVPGNEYGLYRIANRQHTQTAWHWAMRLTRQGVVIVRTFSEGTYGGPLAAFTVARAYRDAAMRLIPPLTTRQIYGKPDVTNQSGVVGVRFIEAPRKPAWEARAMLDGRRLSKTFSVELHGARRAKALAMAQRAEYEQCRRGRFATVNDQGSDAALAHFSPLLQPDEADAQPPSRLRQASVQRRIRFLDEWFDDLRPCFVQVYMGLTLSEPHPHLSLMVRLDGQCAPGNAKAWYLGRRGLEDALKLAWKFVRERLTESHSAACWTKFRRQYRASFFAFDGSSSWSERFRCDRPGFAQRLSPPGELASLLPGFKVPRMPSA